MRPGQPVRDGKSIPRPRLRTRGICISPAGCVRSGPSETGAGGRQGLCRPPKTRRTTGNKRGRLRAPCSQPDPRRLPGSPCGVSNTSGQWGSPLSWETCSSNCPSVSVPRSSLLAFPRRKTWHFRAGGRGSSVREPPAKCTRGNDSEACPGRRLLVTRP